MMSIDNGGEGKGEAGEGWTERVIFTGKDFMEVGKNQAFLNTALKNAPTQPQIYVCPYCLLLLNFFFIRKRLIHDGTKGFDIRACQSLKF